MGLIAALVVGAIVHPWQATNSSIAVVPRPSNLASSTQTPSKATSLAPMPPSTPGQSANDELAVAVDQLGEDAAPWGVGVGAAVGPPLQPTLEIPALGVATDQAWWAWIVVQPSPPVGLAAAIEALPASKLCSGVPRLPTDAQVLMVTTPSGTADTIQLQAWHEVGWHDEPRDIEPLAGLISAVSQHAGDVSYLRLANGSPWPDGRYELHVDGPSKSSLTVCLGQP